MPVLPSKSMETQICILYAIKVISKVTVNLQKPLPEVYYKKGVLENFTKFAEKTPVSWKKTPGKPIDSY